MQMHRQPGFWHLYHVLVSAIPKKNNQQTSNLYNIYIYTHQHMYKCVYAHMVLLQNKQNEGGHMVHTPVAFTSSLVKIKGGIQLSQLSHQKAGLCI